MFLKLLGEGSGIAGLTTKARYLSDFLEDHPDMGENGIGAAMIEKLGEQMVFFRVQFALSGLPEDLLLEDFVMAEVSKDLTTQKIFEDLRDFFQGLGFGRWEEIHRSEQGNIFVSFETGQHGVLSLGLAKQEIFRVGIFELTNPRVSMPMSRDFRLIFYHTVA